MGNPALDAKKELSNKSDGVMVSSRGIKIHISPVSPIVINKVRQAIKKPKVPVYHNEDTGRDEENPNHPDYLEAIAEYNDKIGMAMLDTAAVFGIELVDPMPAPETWVKKIKYMIKQGLLEDEYDFDDTDDLEFLFIRYFAVSTDELMIAVRGVIPEEAVEQHRESFRGDTERGTDSQSTNEV